jgi:hypothetical protein
LASTTLQAQLPQGLNGTLPERLGADSHHPFQRLCQPQEVEDIPLVNPHQLTFADHGHGFIALNGPLGRMERPNPQPRMPAVFHTPLIVF